MADLFDRFVGSAGALTGHTADSGDTWTDPDNLIALNGSGSVSNPGSGTTNDDWPYSSWTPPGTDYSVKIVIGASYPGAATVTAIGPIVRAQGSVKSSPYYQLQYYESGGVGYCEIDYQSSSGTVNLGSNTSVPLLATGDVLELQVAGAGATVTLTALRNGVQVLQTTDTSGSRITTAGAAGLRCTNAGAGGTDMIRTLWAGAIGGPGATIAPSSATVQLGANHSFTAGGVLPNEMPAWSAGAGGVTPSTGSSTTYTAPASGSSDTVVWTSVDLPTHGASAPITLTAGTLVLYGPSFGVTGSASTAFTVVANLAEPDTVTPASDSGGAFSPSSLSFGSGTSSLTFQFFAASDGEHEISITDSLGAVISDSPLLYTSSTPKASRGGTSEAAKLRRAKLVANLRAEKIPRPAKIPPLEFTPPTPRTVKASNPAPPNRPAVNDARPSKAVLDFPIHSGGNK